MKHKKTRFLALIIILAVSVLLSACVQTLPEDTTEKTVTGTEPQTETAAPETTAEGNFTPVEGLNLDGDEFRILIPKSAGWAQYNDFSATSENEEQVNDACYLRLQQISELYNVKVVETITSSSVANDAKKDIAGGLNTYDAIHIQITEAGPLAQTGNFIDLNTVESMNLENPWYNQNAVKQLSIAHKLFYTLGDISIVDNDGLSAISFNKGMVEESGIDSPYKLIEENKWTIDKMYEMSKGFAKDIDGDGDTDLFDQWGNLSAYSEVVGQLISCGVDIVAKDEEDIPYLCIYSDRTLDAIDKIIEFYADKAASYHLDLFSSSQTPGGVSVYEYGNVMFTENRLLFRQTAIYRVIQCRVMEEDFGIIPYPKLDSAQEDYRHSFSFATPVIAIPSTALDPEVNGAIIEALSYYGRTIVYPAYCERVLKGIVSRDDESRFCLDIIFDSAFYDLGLMLQIGGLTSLLGSYVPKGESTFASDYDKLKTAAELEIKQYTEGFKDVL